jgi:hypothetical protein
MNGIPITEWRMTLPCPARCDKILPMSRLAVFAALLLVLTATPARADGFLTLWVSNC